MNSHNRVNFKLKRICIYAVFLSYFAFAVNRFRKNGFQKFIFIFNRCRSVGIKYILHLWNKFRNGNTFLRSSNDFSKPAMEESISFNRSFIFACRSLKTASVYTPRSSKPYVFRFNIFSGLSQINAVTHVVPYTFLC